MEPNLALTFLDFKAEVGYERGYGRDESAWTADQLDDIERDVASGQRQVYYPEPLPGESVPHSWTFLRPSRTLALPSGGSEVFLPADFPGHFEGEVVATAADGTRVWWTLLASNGSGVRYERSVLPDRTGRPERVAVEPVDGTTATGGSRWKLVVYPTADRAFTLRLTYPIDPDALAGARPYHYGGPQHSETFLCAVKKAAEEHRHSGGTGLWADRFQKRLIASVTADRKNRPTYLGVNSDPSVYRSGRSRREYDAPTILVNGLTPS